MAKTKVLISFAVTAKLICVFVFAYAKNWFSHDAAHLISQLLLHKTICCGYLLESEERGGSVVERQT